MSTVAEIRDMVAAAGMLRRADASAVKPSPVLDAAEVRAVLLAEIDRLRGVVKEAEYLGVSEDNASACPWCSEVAIGQRWDVPVKEPAHRASCEAFTPDGVVR